MSLGDEIKQEQEKNNKLAKKLFEEIEAYGIDPRTAVYYTMDGKKHDDFYGEPAAYKDGCVFDICSPDGAFIRRYSEKGKLSEYLVNGTSDNVFDVESAGPEDLKRIFKMVKAEVNKTTHWYLRSSTEYKDFRESIDNLINDDMTDKNAVYRKMEEVAKMADLYLASKEDPKAKITDNTIPRLKAAHHVSMMMKGCLAPIIEKGIDFHEPEEFEILGDQEIDSADIDFGTNIEEEFVNQLSNDVEPEKSEDQSVVSEDEGFSFDADEEVIDNDSEMFR